MFALGRQPTLHYVAHAFYRSVAAARVVDDLTTCELSAQLSALGLYCRYRGVGKPHYDVCSVSPCLIGRLRVSVAS